MPRIYSSGGLDTRVDVEESTHAVVTAAPYAAVGDGVTDDSAEIQAAIDAVAAAGGGEVFIPEGTYVANELILRKYVHLVGAGWRTNLKAPASQTSSQAVIRATEDAADTSHLEEPYGVAIRNLRIRGNKAGGAAGDGIRLQSRNADAPVTFTPSDGPDTMNDPAPLIENVKVENCGKHGIVLGRNMRHSHVLNTSVYGCLQNGFRVLGTDMFFTNSDAGVCGDGFYIERGNNLFSNCKSWWNVGQADGLRTDYVGYLGVAAGWRITSNGDQTQATGCQAQDNFGPGLRIDGAAGCHFENFVNGGDTDGAVLLTAGAQYNEIDSRTVWADRVQTTKQLVIDGATTLHNKVRLNHDPLTIGSTPTPITLQNGGLMHTATAVNRVGGETFARPRLMSPLTSPWVVVSGYRPPGFVLVDGVVHLFGAIKGGSLVTIAFNLPLGYRPSDNLFVGCTGFDASKADPNKQVDAQLLIASNGDVYPYQFSPANGADTWVAANDAFQLDGVSFPVAVL